MFRRGKARSPALGTVKLCSGSNGSGALLRRGGPRQGLQR